MADGNKIIVSANPKGRFLEGYLIDTGSPTPAPGIVMGIESGVALVDGRMTWEPFGATAASGNNGVAADGDQRLIAILLPDELQGKSSTAAYPASTATVPTRIFMYCPLPGEEFNMIIQDIGGTGADQDFAIGDQLIVDNGTGKLLVAAGSDESEPFQCLEAVVDLAADYLSHVIFTGY